MADKAFGLQSKYFFLVKEGKKTVIGRRNDRKSKNMVKGDIITVWLTPEPCHESKENFEVEILGTNLYKDFKEMLEKEGLKNVIPGCENIEDGIKEYLHQDHWRLNVINTGVIGLQVKVI